MSTVNNHTVLSSLSTRQMNGPGDTTAIRSLSLCQTLLRKDWLQFAISAIHESKLCCAQSSRATGVVAGGGFTGREWKDRPAKHREDLLVVLHAGVCGRNDSPVRPVAVNTE